MTLLDDETVLELIESLDECTEMLLAMCDRHPEETDACEGVYDRATTLLQRIEDADGHEAATERRNAGR